MKVFAVESGEYSDYQVDGLFAKEEDAQRYCDGLNEESKYRHASVNEWEIVEDLGARRETISLRSTIHRDSCDLYEHRQYDYEGLPSNPRYREACHVDIQVIPERITDGIGTIAPAFIQLNIWGRDIERCYKVFSERSAQLTADFDILVEAERLKKQ